VLEARGAISGPTHQPPAVGLDARFSLAGELWSPRGPRSKAAGWGSRIHPSQSRDVCLPPRSPKARDRGHSAVLSLSAVPTGLRIYFGCTNPALKRGANKHCAYGAGDILLPSSVSFPELICQDDREFQSPVPNSEGPGAPSTS